MTSTGYSALEAKNNGMVIACPMPISRSRLSTRPAMVTDRQAKNAAPSTTITATPASLSGLAVSSTPSSAATTKTANAWTSARSPAANALPLTRALRGVGVTSSLVSTRVTFPDDLDAVEDGDEQRRLGDDDGREEVEVRNVSGRDGVHARVRETSRRGALR